MATPHPGTPIPIPMGPSPTACGVYRILVGAE